MQANNIKLIFTYIIVLVVLVGGGAFLYFTRLDPNPDQLSRGGILAAIAASIQFVFNHETATRAAIAATSAFDSGSFAATQTVSPTQTPIDVPQNTATVGQGDGGPGTPDVGE
jgi:type IV secretory pathway TrbL component